MSNISSPTPFVAEHTGEIMMKTLEVIQAYKEAGQKLRKVQQIVNELRAILPPDRCLRFPPGVLESLSTFPIESMVNFPLNANISLPPFFSQIPQESIDKTEKSGIDEKQKLGFNRQQEFEKSPKDEETEEDELFPPPISRDQTPEPSRPINMIAKKKNIRHEPYEKPRYSTTEENSETSDEFTVTKISTTERKAPTLPNEATLRMKSKFLGNISLKTNFHHLRSTTPRSERKVTTTRDYSPPKSPSSPSPTKFRFSESSNTKIYSAEQKMLVDEFIKYLTPRLSTTSQKAIAEEIRQISGNTTRIAQGTISKMIRRVEIPRDNNTVDAIRKWIIIEQSKPGCPGIKEEAD
ncbi:hypothetical protein G9A89_020456 [Geosiphon pyriformis]|nr:hypothetical protein G9A89_020456 [Geosiphon pyriformis]